MVATSPPIHCTTQHVHDSGERLIDYLDDARADGMIVLGGGLETDVELYYDHVYALKGVSLSVSQGETVALIGANGAGKSSILRTITGLATPKTGSVTFQGSRVDGSDPSSIVRRGIAMVPEGRRVFPFMSVKDNLMMGASYTRSARYCMM